DDRVALVRLQGSDDSVEAGVVEAGLHAHLLGDVAADVDVGAFGSRRPLLVRLLRRVRDVAAEDQRAGALDGARGRDRGGDRRGRVRRALLATAAARGREDNYQ